VGPLWVHGTSGLRWQCIAKVTFGHPVHVEGITVKFVFEVHRFKVTTEKKHEISYSRSVKLQSAITAVL